MQFDILTLFPTLFDAFVNESIVKRAREQGVIRVDVHQLRDWATDKHKTVDDVPYGGGPGMLLKPEPMFAAVRDLLERSPDISRERTRVVLLSPQGRLFSQKVARKYVDSYDRMILVCGRYEGFDERIREFLVDEQLSIGHYVLQGGEIPAMVVVEAVSRLVPGVLGSEDSSSDESFSDNGATVEYPQYTRPAEFDGMQVPDVLLGGNHGEIAAWRKSHRRKV
jgi:tRNA (guanine37-N1)-methyltransferase